MLREKIPSSITSRTSNSLNKYLSEISRINRAAIKGKDLAVQKKLPEFKDPQRMLVFNNLGFVITIAKQYRYSGIPLEDLINEGNIGLIQAAKNYRDEGHKFITYAVWWIRRSIIKAVMNDSRIVRIPQNKVCLLKSIYKMKMKFEQIHGRYPTTTEICEALGLDVETIVNALRNQPVTQPLYFSSGDEEFNLIDALPDYEFAPDRALEKAIFSLSIANVLWKLNKREREIIEAYFGLNGNTPVCFESIGFRHGITAERARQIKDETIRKLKKTYSWYLTTLI